MQYYWLNNRNNDNLIIFFCGWSFDYKPFENLDCCKYDILFIYDYTNLTDSLPEIPKYKNYFLLSWSMGVYIAYLLREKLPYFTKKIAINGTPFPIDDEFGIPNRTFDLTLKYVYSGLEGKFQQNLFKCRDAYECYLRNPVARTIENRANELISLNDFIKGHTLEYSEFYDYAIISDTDKIIPTQNQCRCWESRARVIKIDSGHFPFFEFNSWDEIIEKCS